MATVICLNARTKPNKKACCLCGYAGSLRMHLCFGRFGFVLVCGMTDECTEYAKKYGIVRCLVK